MSMEPQIKDGCMVSEIDPVKELGEFVLGVIKEKLGDRPECVSSSYEDGIFGIMYCINHIRIERVAGETHLTTPILEDELLSKIDEYAQNLRVGYDHKDKISTVVMH